MKMGNEIAIAKYEKAVKTYMDNLEANGASPKTIVEYDRFLREFAAFMRNAGRDDGPTYSAIFEWRNELLKKNAKTTVHQKLKVLKIFFAWASDESLQDMRFYKSNPVAKSLFPSLRAEKNRPYDVMLTDDQVIQLLDNVPPVGTAYKLSHWPRNYAIVMVLLTTQLRNSELRALRMRDMDFANQEIRVENGKGGKFRVVDFPPLAQSAVELYLRSGFRPENLADTDYVFGKLKRPHDPKNPVWESGRDNWLSQIIEYHVRTVTGVGKITAHDLRRIGSRIDLNSGMRIEMLQAKLGHTSPVITQIYSGRVMPRGNRESAKRVVAAQFAQTQRNIEQLQAM